jgi:hypothetical protein
MAWAVLVEILDGEDARYTLGFYETRESTSRRKPIAVSDAPRHSRHLLEADRALL